MHSDDHQRRLDLDGLQVFDAVMRERNVTRAAHRLSLTQPAVSHAIARLRLTLKDPLFLKTTGGVRPTRRAEDLWLEVQNALQVLRQAIAPNSFDHSTAQFSVTLAVNDMIVQECMPRWYGRLRKVAPHCKLSVVMRTFGDTETRLAQGMVDFGVGLFYSLPPAIRRRELWEDRFVCVSRKGNPIAQQPWTLETFLSVPHIGVSPEGEMFTYADAALRYAGIERKIGLLVSHFSCVPPLLQYNDMLALLPRFYASAVAAAHGLEIREAPFPMQPVKYELVWHERIDRSPSHLWFRDHLFEALAAPTPAVSLKKPPRSGSGANGAP